jgi:hypothetical protein
MPAKEGRKEGRKDGWTEGQRIGNLWVERGDSACLKERTDIDTHNVKSECNVKIVPFKGVLWLLGGARRQLHGKRRLRVLWLLVGGALVMQAKKGRISTSTAETLIVLLQLLVYTFCNFKGNEIHIRCMLQIHLLFFFGFFFLLDLHFYTVIIM